MLATVLTILAAAFHAVGIACAIHAIFYARSPQGAIAWGISLITFPYLAVPLYLVFGRGKFHGYVQARREVDLGHQDLIERLRGEEAHFRLARPEQINRWRVLEQFAKMPFTHGNHLELLIDGEVTFQAIFTAIGRAERYVLLEFFVVNDDDLGRRLKQLLLERVRSGIKICFIYDEIGSHSLPSGYVEECRQAGIDMRAFHTTQGPRNRFQVNFRNHRKIVVVDGREAFVGGHNVGDEYLGKGRLGAWRDTHVRMQGPAVAAIQLTFFEDWGWAGGREPEGMEWVPRGSERGDMDVLVLPTGPADEVEACGLVFVQAIHAARKRVWMASPYFVPSDEIVAAIHLAALRGVDVRILLPEKPDHLFVYLASFVYIQRAATTGARFFRYQAGFLHQKVTLVDDRSVIIGTANIDNRSLRLNFEVSLICVDPGFAKDVESMLEQDFTRSREVDPNEVDEKPIHFRFGSRVARLLSPIL